MIEVVDDIPRNLHVLDLVLAHRNVSRVVHHDVRRHQHWVREQAQSVGEHVLLPSLRRRPRRLLLELVHSQQTIDVHVVFENPAQLAVIRILENTVQSVPYVRLDEHNGLVVRLQSTGEEGHESVAHWYDRRRSLLDVISQRLWVWGRRQRMVGHDSKVAALILCALRQSEITTAFPLFVDPILESAEVVANVRNATRLDSRENDFGRGGERPPHDRSDRYAKHRLLGFGE